METWRQLIVVDGRVLEQRLLGMKSGKFYWETQNNQTAAQFLVLPIQQQDLWMEIFLDLILNPAWTWASANYYFNSSTALLDHKITLLQTQSCMFDMLTMAKALV